MAGQTRTTAAAAWLILAFLIFFAGPVPGGAQNNPFFAAPAPKAPSVSVPTPRLQVLIDAQRALRELLAETVERSADGGAGGVPALLWIAFAYGLLHALGPGHRKLALAAYFIARPARLLQGVTAGLSVALLHAASAVLAIYGLFYLFERAVTTTFAAVSSILELGSYAAITLLGLVLLTLALRDALRRGAQSGRPAADGKKLAAIILGSGLVPCPGTALILIFCLSQGLPGIGVLAALAMSLGMAVITVSVSLAAILSKQGLLASLARGSDAGKRLHQGLEIGGALLITVFGLFMLSPWLTGLVAGLWSAG
jgi:nickel/cobalt exporter